MTNIWIEFKKELVVSRMVKSAAGPTEGHQARARGGDVLVVELPRKILKREYFWRVEERQDDLEAVAVLKFVLGDIFGKLLPGFQN